MSKSSSGLIDLNITALLKLNQSTQKIWYGMMGGHPKGFTEAFVNIYSNVVEVVAARWSGDEPNTLALDFPTVEDGARGVHFIHKAIESGSNNEWVAMDYEPPASNVKNP